MPKIKIVHIIADSKIGGGPNHVLGLLANLDKAKFDCYLICPSGYLSKEAKKIVGLTILNISMSSKFDFLSILALKRIISKIKIEGNPFGPLVIHSHGPRAGLFASMIASKNNIHKIYTEHRYGEGFRLTNFLNDFVQRQMIRKICRKQDLVIAVSTDVRNFIIKNKWASTAKISVISNAIAASCQKKKINTSTRAPIIGNIGSLNKQKGQIHLIRAFAGVNTKYPLATLEIIGDGPELEVLKEEVRRLSLKKHVTFLGEKKDITRYMRHWSVFALPSIAETFGIVLLEAMNAGVPIVASKIGGVVDIIEDGKEGLLAEPASEKDLALKLLEILDHPALAAKLKRNAYERVKEFDWTKVIKKIEAAYLGVARENEED
ncbi:MAG: glycosyltransferase family 4 protein [Patescibacteria group bacterium]